MEWTDFFDEFFLNVLKKKEFKKCWHCFLRIKHLKWDTMFSLLITSNGFESS